MKDSIKGYKRYFFFALAVIALAVSAILSIDEVKETTSTERSISNSN